VQLCPNCGTENKEEDVYCYRCGALLPKGAALARSTRQDTTILDEGSDGPASPKRRWGTARFDHETVVILHVRGYQDKLNVRLEENRDVTLGRTHGDVTVDIDFTPYKALEAGVSRRHALLRRQNDTVVLMDLGSANSTFLNGQRIIPNEPRILRDGDEVRLGKLVVRASFENNT